MLFEITTYPQHRLLPISRQINQNTWLHTADNSLKYGYKLNEHGGNYLHFLFDNNELTIEFSFFKDYILTQDVDNGVLLSSVTRYKTKLNSNIIRAYVGNEIKFNYYDLRKLVTGPKGIVTLGQAATMIESILVENLLELKNQTASEPLKICYSAGLDSGTLAWLCYKHKIDFIALTDNVVISKLPSLPFTTIVDVLTEPNTFYRESWCGIVPGRYFCNTTHNNYISGFYGDLTLARTISLYIQSVDILSVDLSAYSSYDYITDKLLSKYQSLKFKNSQQLINSIINLHLTPHAQQWFREFETRDPYRDPRLLDIVLSLSIDDIIKQSKTSILQKLIIDNVDSTAWNFLCKRKNDYTNLGKS